jgi:NadR type nicotinamide-nucleotide adenylyltransferase
MTLVRRVAILGAESTGKSTLAAALAERYGTVWVPEYLRAFVEAEGRTPHEQEQVLIARVQREREDAAEAGARRFLFCDTTPLMTAIYSGVYWGRVDPALAVLDRRHDYALTLVAAPDGPWVPDGLQRDSAAVRQVVHAALVEQLERRAIAYTLLTGDLEQRMTQADHALNNIHS